MPKRFEAATKLGISGRRVRYLLAEGRLKAKKLGDTWVVLDLNYIRKRKVNGGVRNRTEINEAAS